MAADVSLKLVTMLPKKHPVGRSFNGFITRFNKEFAGKVRFDWRGGPEVIQQFKQPNAVRFGSIDATITSPSYVNGILKVSGAANYSNKNYQELQASGYHAHMAKLHAAKGLIYVGELPVSPLRFHIFLRKKIKSISELKNLKIRAFPAMAPAVKALGASPLILPMSEIYTAMERGIIDGMVNGVQGVGKQYTGLVKGYITPGMYRGAFHILVNPKSWAKLNSNLRVDVTKYIRNTAATDFETAYVAPLKGGYKRLEKNGIEVIKFSAAEEAKYKKLIFDAAWKSVAKRAPKEAKQLQSMLMK